MKRIHWLFPSIVALTTAACGGDDACGSGMKHEDGSCVADTPEDGAGGETGAAGGSGGTADGAGGSAMAAFGDECADHTECGGETDYCANSPVDPPPYCTKSGCDVDASLCPTDWTCFNVGMFSPGEPYICMRPTT